MEFPLTFRTPNTATTTFLGCKKFGLSLFDVRGVISMKKKRRKNGEFQLFRMKATAERGGRGSAEAVEGGTAAAESEPGGVGRYASSSAMNVTTFNQSFTGETEFPVWEKIGAGVRLSYGIGKFDFLLFILNFFMCRLYRGCLCYICCIFWLKFLCAFSFLLFEF